MNPLMPATHWKRKWEQGPNLLEDRTIRLWELSCGKVLYSVQSHIRTVWSVAFSPDGKLLASGGFDQAVRLWEVSSGKCLQIWRSGRPYERMNITQVKELTEDQKATLRSLGAFEEVE
jgi:WD40 repeat protein